ncbi:ferritin light chain [Apis cerana]|uniref:Ferritin n=2 Tax=Apis cerana TaxID=7461 RepID=A0A2A3EAF2_APICC|nr:ferritin light chain [Apis cerana]XP_016922319.1 ferritin light chain [Apis cerana]XP_016922320.1 ferritin light chain [Apis cerana]PBC28698.1 Ferritin heavy chain [Apis cerana cerana]
MLFFGILFIFLATTSAEYCIDEVNKFCSTTKKHEIGIESNCNATYGNIHELLVPLQSYAYGNIEYSFRFLLMSTYLGNYENQREGFKKLYRKYSDEMWENGIDLIKYITKRGGSMNFGQEPKFTPMIKTLELNEFASLATALEIQKSFANQALKIHEKANKKQDSAIAHYIEEKFLEPQADRVRELAGHIRDMKRFIDESSSHLSIFLFDQYLQQSV